MEGTKPNGELEYERNNKERMTMLENFLLQPSSGLELFLEDDEYNFYNQFVLWRDLFFEKVLNDTTKRCFTSVNAFLEPIFQEFEESTKMRRFID